MTLNNNYKQMEFLLEKTTIYYDERLDGGGLYLVLMHLKVKKLNLFLKVET
jgi:hypothetical protein